MFLLDISCVFYIIVVGCNKALLFLSTYKTKYRYRVVKLRCANCKAPIENAEKCAIKTRLEIKRLISEENLLLANY